MARDIEFERTHGADLRFSLADNLVQTPREVFLELVSNSYDEDAQNVDITLEDDLLRIQDDGLGMDKNGLDSFIRMGDSPKVENPVSPSGRNRIGKFGIAAVLLGFLGTHYKVTTWREGREYIMEDQFIQEDDSVPYSWAECDPSLHGTVIEVTGLKFTTKDLSSRHISNALAMELPEQDDFRKYLNGREIKRPKRKPTMAYDLETDLSIVGPVQGSLHYFENGAPDSGIYVYVRGRSVGDPKDILAECVQPKFMLTRVSGFVNADGLNDYIQLDRTRFVSGTEAVEELYKYLRSELRDLSSDLDQRDRQQSKERAQAEIPEVIETTQELFEDMAIPLPTPSSSPERNTIGSITVDDILENYPTQTETPIKIEVQPTTAADGFGSYDPGTNTVTINTAFPFFTYKTGTHRKEVLKSQIMYAASYLIGEARLTHEHRDQKRKLLVEMAAQIFDPDTVVASLMASQPLHVQGISLSPSRLYTAQELGEITHLRQFTYRQLANTGALLERDGKFFLGRDVATLLNQFEGYHPANELVHDIETPRKNNRQRVEQLRIGIQEKLKPHESDIPYVKNIGVTSPFYLVRQEEKQRFESLYLSGWLRQWGGATQSLPEIFTTGQQSPWQEASLAEACELLNKDLDGMLQLFKDGMMRGQTIRNEGGKYNMTDLRSVAK